MSIPHTNKHIYTPLGPTDTYNNRSIAEKNTRAFLTFFFFCSTGISVGIKVKQINGDWHSEVQTVLNLWKVLNKGTNLMELPTSKRSADDNLLLRPVDAFVDQELNFAVRLVKHVHKSLAAINQTIRGNTRPSPTVLDTINHLLRFQVISPTEPFFFFLFFIMNM